MRRVVAAVAEEVAVRVPVVKLRPVPQAIERVREYIDVERAGRLVVVRGVTRGGRDAGGCLGFAVVVDQVDTVARLVAQAVADHGGDFEGEVAHRLFRRNGHRGVALAVPLIVGDGAVVVDRRGHHRRDRCARCAAEAPFAVGRAALDIVDIAAATMSPVPLALAWSLDDHAGEIGLHRQRIAGDDAFVRVAQREAGRTAAQGVVGIQL